MQGQMGLPHHVLCIGIEHTFIGDSPQNLPADFGVLHIRQVVGMSNADIEFSVVKL